MKWRVAKHGDHTQNLCSAFNPSKCTHTQQWTHTHTVNTHPEQWAVNAAAPGEQLGVWCLAQGGESTDYSLSPPTIPAGPETRTRILRATSLTLYPLGHDCPIREYKKGLSLNYFMWQLRYLHLLQSTSNSNKCCSLTENHYANNKTIIDNWSQTITDN